MNKIAILKERRAGEPRVAASPDMVKKLKGLGFQVSVETGAGDGAKIPDDQFLAVGANIAQDAAQCLKDADIVLKVQRPLLAGEGEIDELALMKPGTLLVGILNPYGCREQLAAYAAAGVNALAMEFMPRITRAQVMDVLSSQTNLAGYKAVIDAAGLFGHAFPMMMTAAGTVAPAKVFIMGVGVAGLQAIATAKRLGAVVSATDVRPAVKEQVRSLGGTFVAVENDETRQAETAGGYAKEMSDAYKRQQAALIAEHIKKQDIVITTAQIPGRKAPILVTAEHVASMKPGAVIVDLAIDNGGNVEGALADRIVETPNGVSIVGHTNYAGRLAADASFLYSKNLLALLQMMNVPDKGIDVNWDDEIVRAIALTHDGRVVHAAFAP